MSWVRIVVGLYALLNIGGGIEGYVAKGSLPSVISGTVAGILLLGALAYSTSNPKIGYIICGVIALADLGFFGKKLTQGFVLWPAGVMAVASVIVIICAAMAAFGGKSAS
ncbi:MAG TPA: TMEM14 family protein [Fimbriimonadaceae bacterium]|jgi:uncharacterized membrane protein (UPF0136 family)